MLTSGAMTHRLDRLENSGWIERRPDPDDRRGVKVHLTKSGRDLVDRAIEARFEEASLVEVCAEAERGRYARETAVETGREVYQLKSNSLDVGNSLSSMKRAAWNTTVKPGQTA